MSTGSPKHAIFISLAEVALAIGHVHRLELLDLLAQGPSSVEKLAVRSKMSFANTSRHLQILRRGRVVEAQRNGKHIIYRLAGDSEVVGLIRALGRIGERNIADVRALMTDFFRARDALEPIAREELLSRLRNGLVTVLDVRPEDEFAHGHIATALNIPIDELDRRHTELPEGPEIIAYCRGPYCVFSLDAVTTLRERGFQARRLEDGYPEWKAAGLPIEGQISIYR